MRKLKVGELIFDYDLYPRNDVDSHNVNNLKEAIAADAHLPPIVVDKKSRRIVDGFHRAKAYIALFGSGFMVEIVEKEYRNEQEMFLDSMRYNASHGAKLDAHDRTHCMIVAERLKLSIEAVAGALSMSVDKLAYLRSDRTATSGSLTIPIKRTIAFKAGMKLTKRQVEANDKLSGMNQQFYANQLIELLESDLINHKDVDLMERLHALYSLLEVLFAQQRSKAA